MSGPRLALVLAAVAVMGIAASRTGRGEPAPAAGDRVAAPDRPAVDRTAWLRGQLASAEDGATIDVPAGVYRGPFVIARPVRLRSAGGAHLLGDGQTHVVAVTAADVTIEGFEITGSGLDLGQDHAAVHVTGARATVAGNWIHASLHGIYVREAEGARILRNTIEGAERVTATVDPFVAGASPADGELCESDVNQNRRGNGIHIWNANGHHVAGNRIRATRDGIYLSFVDGSDVRDNRIEGVRYGLHYMYSDENVFEDNVFRDNAAGAAIMSSKDIVLRRNQFLSNRSHRSYGVLLQTVDGTTLEANRVVGNSVGVFFESGHGNRIVDNAILDNHIGIHASDSSDGNVFTGNTLQGNLHTIDTTGGNLTSRWADRGRGNYWDGAVTLDLDGNGIADMPHRELDLFGRVRRELPAIGLLAGSPGERLLRFVHARLALPGLPGVVDPSPLVSPPQP